MSLRLRAHEERDGRGDRHGHRVVGLEVQVLEHEERQEDKGHQENCTGPQNVSVFLLKTQTILGKSAMPLP